MPAAGYGTSTVTLSVSSSHSISSTATLSPILGRYYQQTWIRGEGHRLYDSDGRAYLDFANGIAVTGKIDVRGAAA